jgi:hypothetical protein
MKQWYIFLNFDFLLAQALGLTPSTAIIPMEKINMINANEYITQT